MTDAGQGGRGDPHDIVTPHVSHNDNDYNKVTIGDVITMDVQELTMQVMVALPLMMVKA